MAAPSKTNADFSSGVAIGTIKVFVEAGAPTISAPKGSLYVQTDATSTTTRLYVNTGGSTVWTGFTSEA